MFKLVRKFWTEFSAGLDGTNRTSQQLLRMYTPLVVMHNIFCYAYALPKLYMILSSDW